MLQGAQGGGNEVTKRDSLCLSFLPENFYQSLK